MIESLQGGQPSVEECIFTRGTTLGVKQVYAIIAVALFCFLQKFYNDFMFEVRVEAGFSAAHFLKDYNGKCENLHGHNYKVFAHVRGSVLNEGGMLLDFSKLKGALRTVCKKIDHTNLNDMALFKDNPSAERIAVFIYDQIISHTKEEGIDLAFKEGKKEAYLYSVDVFETDTSRATYCPCL